MPTYLMLAQLVKTSATISKPPTTLAQAVNSKIEAGGSKIEAAGSIQIEAAGSEFNNSIKIEATGRTMEAITNRWPEDVQERPNRI